MIFAFELLRDMLTFFDSSSKCLNSASAISMKLREYTLISANIDEMAKEFRLSQKEGKSLELVTSSAQLPWQSQ